MTLQEVADRLYNRLNDTPQLLSDFQDRVDLEIKDNVRFRHLHTWGRKTAKAGLDSVWADAWLNGDFSHVRGTLSYRHPDNLTSPLIWLDLRFNRLEINNWLPPQGGVGGY